MEERDGRMRIVINIEPRARVFLICSKTVHSSIPRLNSAFRIILQLRDEIIHDYEDKCCRRKPISFLYNYCIIMWN